MKQFKKNIQLMCVELFPIYLQIAPHWKIDG
jgi:hypothetical protein